MRQFITKSMIYVWGFVGGLIILDIGCATKSTMPVETTGLSSIKFVEQPSKGSTGDDGSAGIVPPEPIPPFPMPVYPKNALDAHAGTVIISCRLTIDKTGRISNVEKSPFAISTPTKFLPEFLASIQSAVSSWRFHPAVLQQASMEKSDSGHDTLSFQKSETIEFVQEVRFTFLEKGSASLRQ